MKRIIAAVALLAAAAGASAEGFYTGLQVGQSRYETTCDEVSGAGITCDNKGNAWKALGGYRFHPNVAAEVSYADLGEAKATGPAGSITASSTAFDLSAVASFSPVNRLSLHGRAGIYRAKTEVRASTVTFSGSDSDTNVGAVYGVGVSFDVTRRLTARAEWQRYNDVGGDNTGKDDISLVTLGVLFRF